MCDYAGVYIFILVKCPFFALEYFSCRIGHVFERACMAKSVSSLILLLAAAL